MIEQTITQLASVTPLAFDVTHIVASTGGLLESLVQLVTAVWGVLVAMVMLVLPWSPLIAWIAFWLFAVNWGKFRAVLLQGAWVGVVLLGLVTVLVWGTVAPPADGSHYMFGLTLTNYVGKTVYVTTLFCMMFLCGSVQLAGFCPGCCRFEEDDEPADDHAHAAH